MGFGVADERCDIMRVEERIGKDLWWGESR